MRDEDALTHEHRVSLCLFVLLFLQDSVPEGGAVSDSTEGADLPIKIKSFQAGILILGKVARILVDTPALRSRLTCEVLHHASKFALHV